MRAADNGAGRTRISLSINSDIRKLGQRTENLEGLRAALAKKTEALGHKIGMHSD